METITTESQRYKTLLGFGKFFGFIGWAFVVIGGIIFLAGLSGSFVMSRYIGGGIMGLLTGLLVAVYGLMLVASGQGISCFVSIEHNTHATMVAQQTILTLMSGKK